MNSEQRFVIAMLFSPYLTKQGLYEWILDEIGDKEKALGLFMETQQVGAYQKAQELNDKKYGYVVRLS